MRPTFQKASEDLKQTSILRQHQTHTGLFKLVIDYTPTFFLFFSACLLFVSSPNSDLRAVEFFIRDKYEKKKYYSENVTNGSSVCSSSHVIHLTHAI